MPMDCHDRFKRGLVDAPRRWFEVCEYARAIEIGHQPAKRILGFDGRGHYGPYLAAEKPLVGLHELRRSNVAGQNSLDRSSPEIAPQLALAIPVFVDISELEQRHLIPHASSHEAARVALRVSIVGVGFSPASTDMEPSGFTLTLRTHRPALSAALTARR